MAIALPAAVALTAALAPAAPAATSKLYAFMDGKAETSAGDPDGHARIGLTFDRGAGRVCYDVRKFKLETVAGMHIHKGAKGKDGPDVVEQAGLVVDERADALVQVAAVRARLAQQPFAQCAGERVEIRVVHTRQRRGRAPFRPLAEVRRACASSAARAPSPTGTRPCGR
jgi:hypothetical protein